MANFNDLPGVKREPVKPMREMGAPGFSVVGGYIQTKERNPRLIGEQKYLTASDMMANVSIVGAGLHYFLNLVASPNWKVEPVDDTPQAQEYADFVEECMYDMEQSWMRTIRRSGIFRFYGFGIQEWTAKRREDGRTGFASVESRPQFTVNRWDIDGGGSVRGVWQLSPQTFEELYVPRAKMIYLVDDTLSDSPEGFGLLRHLAEPAERYQQYQYIEGSGFERDFRGIPIGYAPRAEIAAAVEAGQISDIQAQQMLSGLDTFVKMRSKSTDTGILLDSSTYTGQTETGETVTGNRKWMLDLLTGSSQGIEHVGAAIDRLTWDMAMILGVESLLVGRDSGSRALNEDKSRNLYLNVNSCVGDIAEAFDRDYIGALWKLNGFPNEMRPHLKAEDVSFKSVDSITAALRDMATAGAVITPEDEVVNDVRDLLGVSRQPEDLMSDV